MNRQLTQNLWERFGFRDNPFDTRALSMASDSRLSVAEAFVGRDEESAESQLMTNFLRNPGGGRAVVEGDVGVGKTTFVNFHRYLWERQARSKLLTPASEVSVQGEWGPREFLVSVIGALAGRLALNMKPSDRQKDQLLAEVDALTGVLVRQSFNVTGGITVLGSGASGGSGKSVTVHRGEVNQPTLRRYLDKLMDRVRRAKYAGAILHLNNLELLARRDPDGLIRFFDEIRDCLQTPNIYFVFVGYTGMFQEIVVPRERVRSIFFGHPIYLAPLSCDEVHHAIELRYKLLAIKPKRWIRPVDDTLIDHLYEVFSGKIRFIMDAITTLVSRLPEGVTATLATQAAKELLRQLTRERIRSLLTDSEQKVLLAAVQQRRFTNSSLVKATRKSKQNVAKYLGRLTRLNLVHVAERRGRSVFYETSPELSLLTSPET
jgi:DNA-binding transcriptional ArsR family regulator